MAEARDGVGVWGSERMDRVVAGVGIDNVGEDVTGIKGIVEEVEREEVDVGAAVLVTETEGKESEIEELDEEV